jgi:hypothetical protein
MTKLRLTEKEIEKLKNDPAIQATAEANKAAAAQRAEAKRETDLLLLGYNQALLDNHQWPSGHTSRTWADVIEMQKAKLGITNIL